LEPIEDNWTWLEAVVGPLDDDFVRFVEEEPAARVHPAPMTF
jgi:antitoxin VapB